MVKFTRQGRAFWGAVTVAVAVAAVLCCGCADNGIGGAIMIEKLGGKNDCGKDGTAGSCKTVWLGGKTWMTQNLNYKTVDSWCYDNRESNCNYYGRLYTWEAAKSACQSVGGEWRLPTEDDWDKLGKVAGGGKALKTTFGWNDNGNGTDTYGFSALSGGLRIPDGRFYYAGRRGYWWLVTKNGSGNARYMEHNNDGIYEEFGDVDVDDGYSVRCVQN